MIAIIGAVIGLLWAILSSFRPNVEVDIVTAPQPTTLVADSTTWFVAGLADFGRIDKPILITSINDFISKCGGRVTYSVLYDALDTFFREGGNQAYVGRVVGPSATKGTHTFLDGSAGTSLIISAIGPGATSANITVAVISGTQAGSYQLQVFYNAVLVENTPDLFSQADAVSWATANSNYISIVIGASSLNPANIAATALTAGNDDRASIVDAQWLTALNLFTQDYGPGQVSSPGRTTDVGHTQLLDHASANMRTALLDAPDTATSATLVTSATNAKTTTHGQFGGMFAPWVIVPGVTSGTTRTVPPSALVAGAIARTDPIGGPAVPAAGNANGVSQFAQGVSQPAWDQPTRDTLNTNGVNVIRLVGTQTIIYGWRSLANASALPGWVGLGTVRYLQNLSYRCWQVGQQYLFNLIDGQGQTIARYNAALTALLLSDWNLGEIYGQQQTDAFKVDTGPTINSPASLSTNTLKANIAVRPSPMAELVIIQIVNTPITTPLT
jgi:phage tail sheath protein FI